jgi:hypothetical protein
MSTRFSISGHKLWPIEFIDVVLSHVLAQYRDDAANELISRLEPLDRPDFNGLNIQYSLIICHLGVISRANDCHRTVSQMAQGN